MSDKNQITKAGINSFQEQVEEFIYKKIENGEWSIGTKIPSERELSATLDVSRTTVRNAILLLTTRGLFTRKTGQGTFVKRIPGSVDKATSSKGTLGYVVCKEKHDRNPISSEAFYFDIFSSIDEESSKSGRHTLFSYIDDYDLDEMDMFDDFLNKVDGLVIEEVRNIEFLKRIHLSGIPAVLLAPSVIFDRMDLVSMDLFQGVKRAVGYLRDLGHKQIAIINGPLHLSSAQIRFDAWQEAMTETGAFPDKNLIEGDSSWSAESGYIAMQKLLEKSSNITAVFCANDLLALGALSALSEENISVPSDISIIGFDDTELARHAVPALTTMHIYSKEMARSAAKRVVERIENGIQPVVSIQYPIDLVERNTCKEVKKKLS